ncbi:MAG: helix-turn-helix transcriptional regulator [Clostridia bacterium]|nr:helix-turn-helix transcriptional regulator [Clostridia bacterium]
MGKITVAEKITEFRQRNNLTQGEFGKLLGISAQAISKWEREICYPDITILPDLARVLGCSVNDFFEECDT